MANLFIEQRVAESIAREAGHRMLRARGGGFDVALKAKNDLVTNIDTEIEAFVKGALLEAFPDDTVVGEERGTQGTSTSRRWFVDPIDGTMNFVQGIPIFCVSIGLEVDGRFEVAAIYEPSRDELFSGRRGVAPTLNGAPMSVSETPELADSVIATGFAVGGGDDAIDNLDHFIAVANRARGTRRLGSAAIDLAYVACGRLDGFWEFHLSPWDTAAGVLLVELAGGTVTSLDGARYTGFEKCVVATNGVTHEALLEVLRAA